MEWWSCLQPQRKLRGGERRELGCAVTPPYCNRQSEIHDILNIAILSKAPVETE